MVHLHTLWQLPYTENAAIPIAFLQQKLHILFSGLWRRRGHVFHDNPA